MKTSKKIHFGILIQLGDNKHNESENDPLKKEWFKVIDDLNLEYIYPFGDDTLYEDFEQECDNFEGWAKQIKAFDYKIGLSTVVRFDTHFFFACYITDRDGKPVEVRKIKQLFY